MNPSTQAPPAPQRALQSPERHSVIVKRAMRLCDDYLVSEYPEGRLVLQVHDEIDFEVPARLPKKHVRNLKALMEQAASEYGIHAPVEISLITHRWDKETKICL